MRALWRIPRLTIPCVACAGGGPTQGRANPKVRMAPCGPRGARPTGSRRSPLRGACSSADSLAISLACRSKSRRRLCIPSETDDPPPEPPDGLPVASYAAKATRFRAGVQTIAWVPQYAVTDFMAAKKGGPRRSPRRRCRWTRRRSAQFADRATRFAHGEFGLPHTGRRPGSGRPVGREGLEPDAVEVAATGGGQRYTGGKMAIGRQNDGKMRIGFN